MIYVVDAAAVVDLLIRSEAGERARTVLRADRDAVLVTVSHLDAEVLSALARLHRSGTLTASEVTSRLDRLGELSMQRVPITADLLRSAWSLRDNVAARDALYVAAADALDARLLTTDDRLARATPQLVMSLE